MDKVTASDTVGGWCRFVALGLSTVFVLCAAAAVVIAYKGSVAPDFLSFWAAGRLVADGQQALVYDIARHHAVEASAVPSASLLPFPYPPFVLPLLVPFGILPFWIAFAAWLVMTAALYLAVTRQRIEIRFSLAQAGAAANFITGQNGFLTSAMFISGTRLLSSRPFLAGAVLGLLSFKPQLSILLPLALLAGREWRAIGGGIASSLALFGLGLLLSGVAGYSSFLSILPRFSQWLSVGRWPWGELASTLALLSWFGVAKPIALAVQACVAFGGAALTARAWALKSEQRVEILAAATLLVPPYLFTYDSLLLTLPLAWLARKQEQRREFVAVWILALLPVNAYFRPFPNTIPLAAMLALWALHRGRAAADAADAAPTKYKPGPRRRATDQRFLVPTRSASA